ncbi:lymphocyte cytosolic protein 2 isoform X2 [Eleutherodactylus coqui]|uniref:lymphocyte cytosolic protein 2 isoform X2 n=1 Tax=Eleutherodactylus coqui TaxID=57060 RepID=UPI003462B864
MDFRKVPSCTEVSSWSPEALIDYFRMCNLRDCEKLVKKQGIDGRRFLEMSETDMQKFPKTRVPSDPQKGYSAGKLHVPYTPSNHDANQFESWDEADSDSFDDDDYEDPDEPVAADYESPTAEDNDSGNSDDYEPPPSNNDIPISLPKTNSYNTDYIDRPIPSNPVRDAPNPPIRTGLSGFSKGNTFPGIQPTSNQDSPRLPKPTKSPAPSVDRTTKPSIQANAGKLPPTSGKNLYSQEKAITLPPTIRPPGKPEHLRKPVMSSPASAIKSSYPSLISDVEDTLSLEENGTGSRRLFPHHSNTFPSTSPKLFTRNMVSGSNTLPTPDMSHSASPLQGLGGLPYPPYKPDGVPNGRPPAPIPVTNIPYNATPTNDGICSEQWYLGNMSRRDAENALRSINKDGTFLVRNCSQSTLSQPYVLMVLYRNKVYNIRIRYNQNDQVYLLGSGGHETFDSVSDIIDYFRKIPLLLIDGKDRGSRQHCKLSCIADRTFI